MQLAANFYGLLYERLLINNFDDSCVSHKKNIIYTLHNDINISCIYICCNKDCCLSIWMWLISYENNYHLREICFHIPIHCLSDIMSNVFLSFACKTFKNSDNRYTDAKKLDNNTNLPSHYQLACYSINWQQQLQIAISTILVAYDLKKEEEKTGFVAKSDRATGKMSTHNLHLHFARVCNQFSLKTRIANCKLYILTWQQLELTKYLIEINAIWDEKEKITTSLNWLLNKIKTYHWNVSVILYSIWFEIIQFDSIFDYNLISNV